MLPYLISVLVLIFLTAPYWLTRLSRATGVSRFLNDIVVCYLLGLLIGNTKSYWLPNADDQATVKVISENFMTIPVLLAIPMLLMTTHIKEMLRTLRPVSRAFFISAGCVVVSSLLTAWYYSDTVQQGHLAAGMFAGGYIGGSPNMLSISRALEVDSELFGIVQATDLFCSGLYLIFMTASAKAVLGWILPPYKEPMALQALHLAEHESAVSFGKRMQHVSISLLIAMCIAGVSFAIAAQFPNEQGEPNTIVLMLSISTLGILVSFIERLRHLQGIPRAADYLLLIFAVSAGSMASFATLVEKGGDYLGFNMLLMWSAVFGAALVARLFKVDVETFIVGNSAAIFGPGFTPQICAALGNKHLLPSGIAAGILGYLIANYIGLAVSAIAKMWYVATL